MVYWFNKSLKLLVFCLEICSQSALLVQFCQSKQQGLSTPTLLLNKMILTWIWNIDTFPATGPKSLLWWLQVKWTNVPEGSSWERVANKLLHSVMGPLMWKLVTINTMANQSWHSFITSFKEWGRKRWRLLPFVELI